MKIKPGLYNIFFKRFKFEMINEYFLSIKEKTIYSSQIQSQDT